MALRETACFIVLDHEIKFNSPSEIKQQARNYFRRLLLWALRFTSQNTKLDMLTFQFTKPSKPKQPQLEMQSYNIFCVFIIFLVKKN